MALPEHFSFIRYLLAKKSVDDRALNRHVLDNLVEALSDLVQDRPVRIIEVGAGLGTMVERLVDWAVFAEAEYTLVDADAKSMAEARCRLSRWAADHDWDCRAGRNGILWIETETGLLRLSFHTKDIYDFRTGVQQDGMWDVLIAHAFMDLMDLSEILPRFCALLKPSGLLYLTLNFDGETVLLPCLDLRLDARIIECYHQSMDQRMIKGRRSGDSRTGRHLFDQLQRVGATVLAAGSSDWIVFPSAATYPADESYFLHFMIHTIETELRQNPMLDSRRFTDWVKQRHDQIERGELVFMAKQLDLLARLEPDSRM